ncbi:HepT-like ribonuclease domain-containing protein [Methylococcus geothermalis]|uniref:DUF86 domain-containing protein n=1 Tax=Methylococcus geothermalis TaxID=2681310 RepID=A0A858Q8A2_9GAMM|nr:HepT-like ribonuclease domain-containing protein [Methylococcus geothermalis]QJD30079.1 DUF86 domain-containing protein [Methylococcus geothermalis]
MTRTQCTSILRTLLSGLPQRPAVDAFGSRIRGDARPDSDLDLAVPVAGYADPVVLWERAGALSDAAGCPVDLRDPRAASTLRREWLGVPQSAWDVFAPLAQGGWIEPVLADALKGMVGFRNIAVDDDQGLQSPITVSVIEQHADEFPQFSRTPLLRDTVE